MIYYGYEPDGYNYISHHGVPGQHWGVTHGPPYPIRSGTKVKLVKSKMTKEVKAEYKSKVGRKEKNKEKPVSKQLNRDRRMKTTLNISSLTDDQLRERIARLELENKYREALKKRDTFRAKTEKGKAASNGILHKVGETVAVNVADAAVKSLSARLTSKSNVKAAARNELKQTKIDKLKVDRESEVRRYEAQKKINDDYKIGGMHPVVSSGAKVLNDTVSKGMAVMEGVVGTTSVWDSWDV